MWGIFRRWGTSRRPVEPTEDELRAARIAAFDRLVAAARNEKHGRWVSLGTCIVLVLAGLGYATIGIVSGANVDWDLSQWVHNGKSGGPLLFVYIVTGLICVLLTGAGIAGLISARRESVVARAQLRDLVAQHETDLLSENGKSLAASRKSG